MMRRYWWFLCAPLLAVLCACGPSPDEKAYQEFLSEMPDSKYHQVDSVSLLVTDDCEGEKTQLLFADDFSGPVLLVIVTKGDKEYWYRFKPAAAYTREETR